MEDILEFIIRSKKDDFYFSDEIADKFIYFMQERSIFWGGGYSPDKINGGLYIDQETSIDINIFINELIDFFLDINKDSKIEINIEEKYFDKFNFNAVNKYSLLLLEIKKWKIIK